MASETARRRIEVISSHITAQFQQGTLAPMRCASFPKPAFSRYDNMLLFARQGNLSQGYFMRQLTTKQYLEHVMGKPHLVDISSQHDQGFTHRDYNYSNASQEPAFSRPSKENVFMFCPGKSRQREENSPSAVCTASKDPAFSRPSKEKKKLMSLPKASQQSEEKDPSEVIQEPLFARSSSLPEKMEWCPQMDVVELGNSYDLTIELPGVSAKSLRVEVDDKRLIVTGKRPAQWWRNGDRDLPLYHKQEIAQGPYRCVWNLPQDSNIDGISADFVCIKHQHWRFGVLIEDCS